MLKYFYYTLSLLLISSLFVAAQTRTISGQLLDEETKEPLVFATVLITDSNPSDGIYTDIDGKFTLEVAANYTQLTFSYIGYKTQTLDIPSDGSFMQVKLQEAAVLIGDMPRGIPAPKIKVPRTVSGQLLDKKTSSPLFRVKVLVGNSNPQITTTTNMDGKFMIEVPDNYTQLTFSYVGYKEQTIDISNDGSFMDIKLEEIPYGDAVIYIQPKVELSNTPPAKFIIRF